MKRKLVFSERYAIDALDDLGDPIDPEKWLPAFRDPLGDRGKLADRLIEMARRVSRSELFDMDIYDSPRAVEIELFLEPSVYMEDQPKQLAALLSACDELQIFVCPETLKVCLSMSYERES